MMLKTGLFALIAMTATTSAAMADCRFIGFTFYPPHNDSVSATGVSTGGSPCTTRYHSLALLQFNLGNDRIPAQQRHFEPARDVAIKYAPKAGFKGTDRYSVRVCGTGGSGSGCSTLSYAITVQ